MYFGQIENPKFKTTFMAFDLHFDLIWFLIDPLLNNFNHAINYTYIHLIIFT